MLYGDTTTETGSTDSRVEGKRSLQNPSKSCGI